MNHGLISIIIPVYNREDKIGRCLDSILAQTFHDLEILIVDDGSTDQTLAVCESYIEKDQRIQLFQIEHRGVSAARNKGIEEASGRYLLFVDSDDCIDAEMTAALMAQVKASVLVMCGYVLETENKAYVHVYDEKQAVSLCDKKELAVFSRKSLLNSPCNKLYEHQIIMDRQLRFKEELHCGEDLVFNMNYLLAVDQILVINQPYYHYCWGGSSLSRTLSSNSLLYVEQMRQEVYALLPFYHLKERDIAEIYRSILAMNLNILDAKGFYYRLMKKDWMKEKLNEDLTALKPLLAYTSVFVRLQGWLLEHQLYTIEWLLRRMYRLVRNYQ
ncbi:glycosyltransferase family 2 protein [Dielma fastidiosa]|uniref:Glycosyltransferase family 2 protein n=1 Tax=Dielma fastidiosa TaxID=1034346 RepID=A0AB35UJ39_9FIRM|nr:glycosyltransferase family A protein [Dielma fastidiosa]MDY5166685.1 glycosyltransferase family 2 protein [Dielma fastidiosa]